MMDQRKRVCTWTGLYAVLLLLAVVALRAEANPLPALTPTGGELAWLPADCTVARPPRVGDTSSISAAGTITVTQIITGLADTEVVEGYPTANCADTLGGHVGYDEYLNPDGKIVRTLVRFSLAQLPPGATIAQAVLELYVGGAWGYNESLPLQVYRLTEPWVDTTTTWNNQPAFAEMFADDSLPFAIEYWQPLDVTDLVRKWHDGTYPNEGIVLRSRESPLGWRIVGRSKTTTPPRMRVTYSYAPGFASLAVPSAHTVLPGQAVSSTVYVSAIGEFSQTVSLAIGGLPADTAYALGSSALNPPASATLWITTARSTPLGVYTVTVTGTSGSLAQTTEVRLRVSQPDFDLSLSPAQQTVFAGGQARYTVGLEAVSGFTQPVTLSLAGLPTGIAWTWAENPVTPTASPALTLTTASATSSGWYTFTVTGAGGGLTHTAQAALQVNRGVYLPAVLRAYPQAGAGAASPESGVRAAAGPESLAVLSIGIADYAHMVPTDTMRAGAPGWDLIFATADADGMYAVARVGTECPWRELNAMRCQIGHARLLLDAQATKAAIHDAIVNWLAPLEGPNTTVVIMFSGHGMYAPDDDGDDGDGYDEFLVPYDILPDGDGWDVNTAIRDDELAQWLSALESQRVVVLLDSCFSGGMFAADALQISTLQARGLGAPILSAQGQEGFAQDIQGSGRVILTASAEGEASWESGELGHGVFTYYLLDAFRTSAADLNANGWVSAQEAYAYLVGRVDTYVQTKTGSGQHPQIEDQVGDQVDLIKLQPALSACPFGP